MKICNLENKNRVEEIVAVHMQSFTGFFLTFLGKGFLKQLYSGFMSYSGSGIITAVSDNDRIVGFLAYSDDLSGFYKYLIKRKFIPFAWYSICSFFRNPKVMFRLFRAFTYSGEAKREEKYIELSSIGVLPEMEGKGIGSQMIDALKQKAVFINDEIIEKYDYIKLETDSVNNEPANTFYKKNGFVLYNEYITKEGRKMNEYRFRL